MFNESKIKNITERSEHNALKITARRPEDVSCKRRLMTKAGDGKIVDGYNTTIKNVPYQMYLLILIGTDYYQCGGSIISSRYVLTAAHCLTGVSQISIRAGSTDANNGGQTYMTSTYFQHPQYNSRTSDYDVGVVRLQRAMTLDNVTTKAVKLAANGSDVSASQDLLVTGCGATRGDSGGPAVLTSSGQQAGIVSFGYGCARPGAGRLHQSGRGPKLDQVNYRPLK